MYSFSYLEPVCCSMSSSNCCLLTCIQISQEAGQVVWYSHLFKNFPQFVVIHTVKGFGIDRKSTRLNSSHHSISYAVFCLKKKKVERANTGVTVGHRRRSGIRGRGVPR